MGFPLHTRPLGTARLLAAAPGGRAARGATRPAPRSSRPPGRPGYAAAAGPGSRWPSSCARSPTPRRRAVSRSRTRGGRAGVGEGQVPHPRAARAGRRGTLLAARRLRGTVLPLRLRPARGRRAGEGGLRSGHGGGPGGALLRRDEETSVVRAINGGPALPAVKPPRPGRRAWTARRRSSPTPRHSRNWPWPCGSARAPTGRPEPATRPARSSRPCPAAAGPRPVRGPVRRSPARAGPCPPRGRGGDRRSGGRPGGRVASRRTAGPVADARGVHRGLQHPRVRSLRASHAGVPRRGRADAAAFLDQENARQCGPCIRGTQAIAGLLGGLMSGTAGPGEVARLERMAGGLARRGNCATPDAAGVLVASLFRHHRALVNEHAVRECARCARVRPFDMRIQLGESP